MTRTDLNRTNSYRVWAKKELLRILDLSKKQHAEWFIFNFGRKPDMEKTFYPFLSPLPNRIDSFIQYCISNLEKDFPIFFSKLLIKTKKFQHSRSDFIFHKKKQLDRFAWKVKNLKQNHSYSTKLKSIIDDIKFTFEEPVLNYFIDTNPYEAKNIEELLIRLSLKISERPNTKKGRPKKSDKFNSHLLELHNFLESWTNRFKTIPPDFGLHIYRDIASKNNCTHTRITVCVLSAFNLKNYSVGDIFTECALDKHIRKVKTQ